MSVDILKSLDVAIGLSFLFLTLALVVGAIRECLSRFFDKRSDTLIAGIRSLLAESKSTGIATQLLDHPLIKGLGEPKADGSVIRLIPLSQVRRAAIK